MITGSFDARQFQPVYSVGQAHPLGIFDAQITNTEVKPVKDNPNFGLFEVEFTTPAGKVVDRFNLWNQSAQAVEIAHKQLSALCFVTGVFVLDYSNQGAALRGARCKIEVGEQVDKKTKQATGYVEIKKVMDLAGNEPGKTAAPAPQTQPQGQQGAPMTQQPGGGWSNPPPQQNNAPANAAAPQGNGWGGPAPQSQQPQGQGGWQPPQGGNGQAGNNPNTPWGSRT